MKKEVVVILLALSVLILIASLCIKLLSEQRNDSKIENEKAGSASVSLYIEPYNGSKNSEELKNGMG